MPNITFVDEADNVIGYGSRTEAISKGLAHRVVRIYITNSSGDILIQKRSAKVDLPNRWDQSAAGHVDEGEDYETAALRELNEEVGIADVNLQKLTKYYAEEDDGGELKKRFNVLYVAEYNGPVQIDNDEVSEIKWVEPEKLKMWMNEKPEDFTEGFLESYRQYIALV